LWIFFHDFTFFDVILQNLSRLKKKFGDFTKILPILQNFWRFHASLPFLGDFTLST